MVPELTKHLVELIRRASTDLSPDVEQAIKEAQNKEPEGSTSQSTFKVILQNVQMARKASTPMCQDTGLLVFYIDVPRGTDIQPIKEAIKKAAQESSKKFYLRPNAVNPITGKNSGNNCGEKAPYIHFNQWNEDYYRYRLMLKGGGSENIGKQYTLPDSRLNAGRDMNGVKKCVIDAVFQAQGKGCSPGIIGVGIGGDRGTSFLTSKEQFFRKMWQRNPDPQIAKIESELLINLNRLQIGPMGFGGKTTVMDVFIGFAHRHPACFFVSVSYMCWANRRKTMTIKNGEVFHD